MARPNETRISDWVRRAFLVNALVPVLLIEVLLVLGCLAGGRLILEKHSGVLEARASGRLLETTQAQAALLGDAFQRLSDEMQAFTRHLGLALQQPSRQHLEEYKRLVRSPEGDLHTTPDSAGFSIFHRSPERMSPGEIEKLQRLLRVDPAMQDLAQRHPEIARVRFHAPDSFNISYPPLIHPSPLAPAGQASDGAQRAPAWAEMQTDPPGKGRGITRIAPVYSGDRLEGMAAMDVRSDRIVDLLQRIPVPWQGQAVLLGRNDTPLARSSPETDASGVEPPARLGTLPGEETGVQFDGGSLIAWSPVPSTPWKLMDRAPVSEILAPADRLRREMEDIGWASLSGLIAVNLILFAMLGIRSRRTGRHLATPLARISGMAQAIGAQRFDRQVPPDMPFVEMRETAQTLFRLGRQLNEDRKDRQQAEERLQQARAKLRQQIRECTEQVELSARERKWSGKGIQSQAGYDPRTGLPTPYLFFDRARQALSLARRANYPLAILLIDLEDLPPSVEAQKRQPGSELPEKLAAQFNACLRAGDTVTRLDSDEFAILLVDFRPGEAPAEAALEIIERMRTPLRADGREITLSGRVGISLFPEDGDSVEELLHQADTAIHRARKAGRDGLRITVG